MPIEDLARQVIAYADAQNAGEQPLDTPLVGLSVMRRRAQTGWFPAHYSPVLCVVLGGAKRVVSGDHDVTFRAGESVIISVDLPVLSQVVEAQEDAPYVALALTLDMQILRELAVETGNGDVSEQAGNAISAAGADEAIVNAMGRLFALVDQDDAARVLKPLVLREIHYWLLNARHGAMLRAMVRAGSQAARIAEASFLIRKDFASPLRIADIAKSVGMGVSAFHGHFKSIMGTSPIQYQKLLRLMEARQLIIAGTHSVSEAAFAVGYESPTQFSRDYTRRFGLSPRADKGAAQRAVVQAAE